MKEVIEVKFYSLILTKIGSSILLKPKISSLSNLVIPIYIGDIEIDSISNLIEKKTPNRPLSHDLISNILDNFYISVSSVIITHMINNNLYAKICFKTIIDYEEISKELVCRPSDGIAIALRQNSPIYMNINLVEQLSVFLKNNDDSNDASIDNKEQNLKLLNQLNQNLKEAIKTRNYELAAEIRDTINRIISE